MRRSRCFGAAIVAVASAGVPACDDGAHAGDRGSETHWLDACDSDTACGKSLRCICGACSLACTNDVPCVELNAKSRCAPPSALDAVCPRGAAHTLSLCLAGCQTASDCTGDAPCIDGVCSLRTATASPDGGRGGAPFVDAGSGGRDSGTDASDGGGAIPDAADSGATRDADARVSPEVREGGAPPDAAPDTGTVACQDGFHAVSTGDCKPVLFSANFDDGVLPGPWQEWRRTFDSTGKRVNVGDSARPGFNYGASGSGRSALLATHVGDATWTDYRLDFDAEVLAAGSFNPYGLLSCTRRFSFYFRVHQQSESWNEPMTAYAIGVMTKTCDQDVQGTVGFASFHGYYCPGIGWGCSTAGESRGLVDLNTAALVDGPNHFTVEVVGNVTKFWVNGALIFDYTDDVVPYPTGATPITHGGLSFEWAWELLGWADNVVVTDMR